MKVLFINVVCGKGSTGHICVDLAKGLIKNGHEAVIVYGRGQAPEDVKPYSLKIGAKSEVILHALKSRFLDGMGFGSRKATKKLIEYIKDYNPDIIHLHNLHGYFLNLPLLFSYLKTSGKKVFFTLHDCFALTGHCANFENAGCDKWKTGCHNCPIRNEYPVLWGFDRSRHNYTIKKETLQNMPNMTLITPSDWLAGLIKDSYLRDYPVKVIKNGTDTDVFKPTPSDIKTRLGIEGKKLVLGVASVWEKRKGLCDFFDIADKLGDGYAVVVVGLNEKQLKTVPKNVIAIGYVKDRNELAELYTAADFFVNTTYDDNYPMTNIEAIACGTPVITYKTGGSPESTELFGASVPRGDVDGVVNLIKTATFENKSSIDLLGKDRFVKEHIELYMQ